MFSGFMFYYLLALFGNTASHTLPVEKRLTFYPGFLHYRCDELDPLTIGEGVEIGVELCSLNVFDLIGGCSMTYSVHRFQS